MVKKVLVILAGILVVAVVTIGLLLPSLPRGISREVVVSRAIVVQVARALDMFVTNYSRFPTGDNGTIAEVLMGQNPNGQNPNHTAFLRFQDRQRYNERGEIIDLWKVPLKFVFSNDSVTIYSLGENRKDDGCRLDDIVAKTSTEQK